MKDLKKTQKSFYILILCGGGDHTFYGEIHI